MIVREETTTTRKGATFVAADSVGAGSERWSLLSAEVQRDGRSARMTRPSTAPSSGSSIPWRFQRRRINMAGLTEIIKEAGIVGCGGAGFPTHAKYSGGPVETIIVNGAEVSRSCRRTGIS